MTSTALEIAEIDAVAEANGVAEIDSTAEINRKGEYHSVLAMEAARKMRRTRKKRETGQTVCHHLKMMLASEPVPVCELQTVDPNGRTPRPLHSEPQFTLFELGL